MEDEHNLESNRRTLPLSVDILMGEVPGLHSKSPLQDRTFYTALMLGFTMLTRASNYLLIASATYHLDTEHTAFMVAPAPCTIGAPIEVTADSIGEIPLSRIIGASICLPYPFKGRQYRERKAYRQTVNPPVCVYDIVTVCTRCPVRHMTAIVTRRHPTTHLSRRSILPAF